MSSIPVRTWIHPWCVMTCELCLSVSRRIVPTVRTIRMPWPGTSYDDRGVYKKECEWKLKETGERRHKNHVDAVSLLWLVILRVETTGKDSRDFMSSYVFCYLLFIWILNNMFFLLSYRSYRGTRVQYESYRGRGRGYSSATVWYAYGRWSW